MRRSRAPRIGVPDVAAFRNAQKAFIAGRRAFIESEITTAHAFLSVARTLLTQGKLERVDALLEKARTAHSAASKQLNDERLAQPASHGKLRSDLKDIDKQIAGLQRKRDGESND
jgi:hypothetical protein